MTLIKTHTNWKRALRPANLVTALMLCGVCFLLFFARDAMPWRLGNIMLAIGSAILAYAQRDRVLAWLGCSVMCIFFLIQAFS